MSLLLLFSPSGGPLPPSIELHDLSGIIRLGPFRHCLANGSTNTVTLKGLRNNPTRSFPINATVVLTAVLDESGAEVTDTQGIAMSYVGGTGAKSLYRCAIPHSVALTAGPATVRVTATDAGGNVHTFDHPCTVIAG